MVCGCWSKHFEPFVPCSMCDIFCTPATNQWWVETTFGAAQESNKGLILMQSNHDVRLCGYGSIPIDTIFNGMNIHKSQLWLGGSPVVPGFWPIPNQNPGKSWFCKICGSYRCSTPMTIITVAHEVYGYGSELPHYYLWIESGTHFLGPILCTFPDINNGS